MPSRPSAWSHLWRALVEGRVAALAAAALALVLYAPTLSYDFARDDHDLIAQNGALQGNVALGTLLLSDFTAGSAGSSGKWRPAITLANWLDGRAGAWRPMAFHRTNLFAFVLACVLLAWLFALVGLPRVAVIAATTWFAVMPLHVESVAWISGRTDLFAMLFLLAACLTDHARWKAGANGPGPIALACFALALLSKEVAIILLPVLITLHRIRSTDSRGSVRGTLRWIAPYVVVAVVWAVSWQWVVTLPDPSGLAHVDVGQGRRQALAMLPSLLAFALPWTLRAPDLLPPTPTFFLVASAVLLHAALLALWTVSTVRRQRVGAALAWIWFPLLVPIALGVWRGDVVFAERLMMLPSVGVAWIAAVALASVRARRARAVSGVVLGVLIVTSVVQTWGYVPAWRDDAALFGAVHDRQSENPVGHLGLAGVRLQEGRIDDALAFIDAAEQLDPDIPEIHQYRAEIAFSQGRWDAVVEHAGRTLALDPQRAYPRTLRAAARVRVGQLDAAESELRELLETRAVDPLVSGAWGELLLRRDRGADAEPYLRFAVSRMGGDPRLHYMYGMALLALQRPADAQRAFERATAIDPAAYDAWLRLAWLHHLAGRIPERDAALQRADELPEASDGRADALRKEFALSTP